MPINAQRLHVALSTIHEEGALIFRSGFFEDVLTGAMDAFEPDLQGLLHYLKCINMDLWNIESICLRLNWQKELWNRDEISVPFWLAFSKCDISLFHVEVRSIFDYLAVVIREVSCFPEEVRDTSFRKLWNWVDNPDKKGQVHRILGEDLAELVRSCEWFSDVKEVRDSIVHHGKDILVFPEKDKILFQITSGPKMVPLPKQVMVSERVADFELYAGLYTGYLFAYLEEVGAVIHNKLDLRGIGKEVKNCHPGLEVIRNWIGRVLRSEEDMFESKN